MGVLDALWHQNTADHSAVEYRLMLAGLLGGRSGVAHPDHLKVTQHAGTPNGTIDVAPGTAFIAGSEQTWQGMYAVSLDTVVSRTVTPTGGDPRIDLVIARVRDTIYSAGGDDEDIVVVAGEAAPAPAPPALLDLGYRNYLILAAIQVPASTSVITNAMITQFGARATTVGGVIVCTSGSRPGSAPAGQTIYETDTGRLAVWDTTGTPGWKLIGGPSIQSGVVPISLVNAPGIAGTVTFPAPFAAAPATVLTARIGSNLDLVANTQGVNASQFSYRLAVRNGGNATASGDLHWVAVGTLRL